MHGGPAILTSTPSGKNHVAPAGAQERCGGARGGLEGLGVGLWVCLTAINMLRQTPNPPDDARTWRLVRAEDSGGLWQIMLFMSQSILGTSYDGCCYQSVWGPTVSAAIHPEPCKHIHLVTFTSFNHKLLCILMGFWEINQHIVHHFEIDGNGLHSWRVKLNGEHLGTSILIRRYILWPRPSHFSSGCMFRFVVSGCFKCFFSSTISSHLPHVWCVPDIRRPQPVL